MENFSENINNSDVYADAGQTRLDRCLLNVTLEIRLVNKADNQLAGQTSY